MQGLDKGILFCTYSLLISQSTSVKILQEKQKANPWLLRDPLITDVHAKLDYAEAAWGKLEFGAHFLLPCSTPTRCKERRLSISPLICCQKAHHCCASLCRI